MGLTKGFKSIFSPFQKAGFKDPVDGWLKANPYPAPPEPEGPEAAKARLEEERRISAAMGHAATILTRRGGRGKDGFAARSRLGGM